MKKERFADLEKRRFPRLKDNIFILCSLEASPPVKFKAITCDISAGGLMFETERDISQESELELEIYQPMNRDKKMFLSIPASAKVIWKRNIEKNGFKLSMPILAKVTWIRKIKRDKFEQGENKYRIGAEFLEIKEEDRERISKYVQESMPEK